MIRIGIDARELTLHRTGMHRFLSVFLNGIQEKDGLDLHLFYPYRRIEKIFQPWIHYHSSPNIYPDQWWGHRVLPKRVKKYKIDVFFSPYYKLPLGLNIPSAITVHDILPLKYPNKPPVLNALYRQYFRIQLLYSLKHAKLIFTDSRYLKNLLEKEYPVTREKVSHNPIPVDPVFFQSVSLSSPFPFRYMLYVGNLKPHKNIPVLLRAYAGLPANLRKQVHLVLTGHDPRLQGMADSMGFAESFHFAGFIPDEYLPRYYAHSLFTVFPSLAEGYGLPLLEANAAKKTVIASNTTSLPEVGGDAAVYFSPGSPSELTRQMKFLIENPGERINLEKKALQNAKKISARGFVQNIVHALKSSLDSS